MKFLAYGPVSVIAAFLVVDTTPIIPDVGPQMLQGGILGVLGWTIYYVFVKLLPAQAKAQKEQREAFLKLLKDLNLVKDKDK